MLTLIIVMLPTLYIFRKVKQFVSTLSKIRQTYDRRSVFLITQTFSGIKDLLIFNKSKIFSDQYDKSVQASSAANSKNSFLVHLPRNILELFLIVGIAVMFIYLSMGSDNYKNELLKIMAAFAIASLRIMPALTRIIVAINTVNFMLPALDSYNKLIRILNRSKKITPRKIDFEKIIIKNLTFKYQYGKIYFKNFSMTINKNQKIGIIGENFSGKST